MSQVFLTTPYWSAYFFSVWFVPVRAALRAGIGQCSATLHLHFNTQFVTVKDFVFTCHISCERNNWKPLYNMWEERNVNVLHLLFWANTDTLVSVVPVLCATGKVQRAHFSLFTLKEGTCFKYHFSRNAFYLLSWWVPEFCLYACLSWKVRLIAPHPSPSE